MGMDFDIKHKGELVGYMRKPYHLANTVVSYILMKDGDTKTFYDGYIDLPCFGPVDLTKEELKIILELALKFENEAWADKWGYYEERRKEYIDIWKNLMQYDTVKVNWC